jgi:hypothetical protein
MGNRAGGHSGSALESARSGLPAILSDALRGIRQSLQANIAVNRTTMWLAS